ncbi:MAG TPA: hypothetical protein VGR15_06530 [Bacteroidota bacterium]|jgi:hypothetical protein|nr:hypothetical protein [Bacteroidota bacterium]
MKQGKRVKLKFPIEYLLLMTPKHKEREKKTIVFVALRTVNEFTNFLYEIVVEPVLNDRMLRLRIQGLRAPQVSIPGTGPAKFSTEFANLRGNYSVVISKPNGQENSFEVNITNEKVVVEKKPRERFVDLVTNEEEW